MINSVRLRAFFIVASVVISGSQAQAQLTSTGNELDLLRNTEVRDKLGLTAAQQEKLAEVAKGANPGKEVFDPFLQRMKEAPKEEHTKIREEMQAAIAKAKEEAGLKALTVLDSRQLKVLRANYLTKAGSRALADPRIATELSLTDEQKKKIEELAKQQSEAARAVPSDATDDAKVAFKKEWDDKALAVLSADQKKIWDGQIAEVPAVAATVPTAGGVPVPAGAAVAPAMTQDGRPSGRSRDRLQLRWRV